MKEFEYGGFQPRSYHKCAGTFDKKEGVREGRFVRAHLLRVESGLLRVRPD